MDNEGALFDSGPDGIRSRSRYISVQGQGITTGKGYCHILAEEKKGPSLILWADGIRAFNNNMHTTGMEIVIATFWQGGQ